MDCVQHKIISSITCFSGKLNEETHWHYIESLQWHGTAQIKIVVQQSKAGRGF